MIAHEKGFLISCATTNWRIFFLDLKRDIPLAGGTVPVSEFSQVPVYGVV